jgi:hypothetical protein
MTERFVNHHQQLDPSEEAAELPLEIINDISSIEGQFVASLEGLVEKEISDTREELSQTPETQTIQEHYGIAYDPYKVVTRMADFAMIASTPDLLRERVERVTVEAIEDGADVLDLDDYRERNQETETMIPRTIYRENGLAYAQDQLDTGKYAPEATRIVDALISGDDSLLSALPPDFVAALRARIKLYENGVPADEREGMISVACNGLADMHGEKRIFAGSPEAKAIDEAWERQQEQKRAA